MLHGIGGGVQAQQFSAFALGDVQLIASGVELHRQRVANIQLFDNLTGADIEHQRGFGFGVVCNKQAPGGLVFGQIQQQCWLAAQRLPACFDFVGVRIDDEDLAAAVGCIQAVCLFRPQQPGNPLAGIFDGFFQLQGFGVYHPNHTRIAHATHEQRAVVQQNFTCAKREALFVALGEHQAFFDFSVCGADRADTAVQRVRDVDRLPVGRDSHREVFQIRMAAANGFQRGGIKLIDHAALHILKALRTGNKQRIAFLIEHHFVQTIGQFTFEHAGFLRGRYGLLDSRCWRGHLLGSATRKRDSNKQCQRRHFLGHQEHPLPFKRKSGGKLRNMSLCDLRNVGR